MGWGNTFGGDESKPGFLPALQNGPDPATQQYRDDANQATNQHFLNTMSAYARGYGPSVAGAQQDRAVQDAQQQALAGVGNTRGGFGGAMAQRNAAGQAMGASGQAIDHFSQARLQEQQEAQGKLMQAQVQGLAQQLQQAGLDQTSAYNQAALTLGWQGIQLGEAAQNLDYNFGLVGAGAGAASGLGSWASQQGAANGGAPAETSDFGWSGGPGSY